MSHKPGFYEAFPIFPDFLTPSHYLFFSPIEFGMGQSEMVVDWWPRKGRRNWLEPLRPRMGSTEAGVTFALWGSAMDNPLP